MKQLNIKHIICIILLSIFSINSYGYNCYNTSCNIYCGYVLGFNNKYVSHGMNFGILYSFNHIMLGCDFKTSLSDPEIGAHSWGGYAAFGYKCRWFGIGGLIGGCSIYNDYYLTNMYTRYDNIGGYGYTYNYYDPYNTYRKYTAKSKFDGGIILVEDIPCSSDIIGICITESFTWYTPISISLGIYFHY
jgi:hypothetical protein